MKKIICLLVLIGLFITVNAQRVFISHKMKTGESVGSIAKKYDVTTDDIYKWNYTRGLTTGKDISIPYYGSKKFRLQKGDEVFVVPDFTSDSDTDEPVDMPLEYEPEEQEQLKTSAEMGFVNFMDVTEIDDEEEWQSIRKHSDYVYKKEGYVKAGQYLVTDLKDFKSDDADVLYRIATYLDNSRNNMNKYNWSLQSKVNMNNAAEILAESYNLTQLDIELNTLRVQFAIQSAQLGNEKAVQLLNQWGLQVNVNNPSGSYQNNAPNYTQPYNNGYQNNGYQNNGNNEARKKQLLNNIATYENRILEIERQKGSGIATNMMGDQTISNYRRMIQEAKAELRSMGYNIY